MTRDDFDDSILSLSIARACEAASFAASAWVGRGDEDNATKTAVEAMQQALDKMPFAGRIVVGEGEEGDAPALYAGQPLGLGSGPAVDIAAEPLEGTTLAAKDLPNALSVIALSASGAMKHMPDLYMDKLAIGPGFAPDLVTLDMPPAARIKALAEARNVALGEITVSLLDRPRHSEMLGEIRATGARIRLISDGDVAGIIHAALPGESGIDLFMGIGGAREGVLAAAALKCLGGQMQGRLVIRSKDDALTARLAGIDNPDQIFDADDLIRGPVVFAATGLTDGPLLKGVRRDNGTLTAETLIMRSRNGTMRRMSCKILAPQR